MFPRLAIGIQTHARLAFNTACLGALALLAGCDSQDADVVEAGAGDVRTIGESASFRGINGIATDGETAWVAGDAANTVYVIDLD